VLHHLVLGFSRHVAREVKEGGFDLSAKSDLRFVEGAWRAFGDVLGLRPGLTPRQFLAGGFAERKVLLLTDVATRCVELHNDAVRQKRLAAVKLRPETAFSLHDAVPAHWKPEPEQVEDEPRPRATAPRAPRPGGGVEGPTAPGGDVDPAEAGPAPRAEAHSLGLGLGAHFLSDLVQGKGVVPGAPAAAAEVPRPRTPCQEDELQEAASSAPIAEPESYCEMLDEPPAPAATAGQAAEATAELLAQLLSSQPEWGASWGAPPTQTAEEAAGAGEEIAELRAQMAELSTQVERMRQTMEARLTVLEGRFTFLEGAVAGREEEAPRGGAVPSRQYSPASYSASASARYAPLEEANASPPAEEQGHEAAAPEKGVEDAGAAAGVGDAGASTLSFINKIKHRFEATEKILKAL
jgi:hypothetical protein